MSEIAIQSNSNEAQHLYQRGLAAARGGQKRVAAGLLTRSLQLDPRNESAWLWLSGVLDDPGQVAFCLNSALKLNPANERARQGLRWLEERKLLNEPPKPSPVLDVKVDAPASEGRHSQGDAWWVGWRQSSREMGRVRLLLWGLPVLLVALALVLYQYEFNVRAAEERAIVEQAALAVAATAVAPTAIAPTPLPLLEQEPASLRESLAVGYLSTFAPLRSNLRTATAAYKEATTRSAGAMSSQVAATQRLRAVVADSVAALEAMRPPAALQAAHENYQAGLALELEGLDAILEFYGSYKVEHANRAAIRFRQAEVLVERARAALDGRALQMDQTSLISPYTAR